jgi:hypothetical protein
MLAGFLDAVGVVPGSLDDAGIAAFAFGVELSRVGDVGHDAVEDQFLLVRGKSRVIGPADDADGPLELDPVGVDPGVRGGGADQGRAADQVSGVRRGVHLQREAPRGLRGSRADQPRPPGLPSALVRLAQTAPGRRPMEGGTACNRRPGSRVTVRENATSPRETATVIR